MKGVHWAFVPKGLALIVAEVSGRVPLESAKAVARVLASHYRAPVTIFEREGKRKLPVEVTGYPVANPTLVHHGWIARASHHVLSDPGGDAAQLPLADLYGLTLAQARAVATALAYGLRTRVVLLDNEGLPAQLHEHGWQEIAPRSTPARRNPARPRSVRAAVALVLDAAGTKQLAADVRRGADMERALRIAAATHRGNAKMVASLTRALELIRRMKNPRGGASAVARRAAAVARVELFEQLERDGREWLRAQERRAVWSDSDRDRAYRVQGDLRRELDAARAALAGTTPAASNPGPGARRGARGSRQPKRRGRKAARNHRAARASAKRASARGRSRAPRGRRKNPGAPPAQLERARKTFKMWHDFDAARDVLEVPAQTTPRVLVKLGEIPEIVYTSNKWEGKAVTYTHKTARPRPLLCTGPDGRGLFIVGGRTQVTERGLVY